ncbi:MAG TPA: lasso peptide biosynthesis B2 protein [Acidimicrobiales bacterium]|nr:lasso peptide biosynthesis B2 protein [Acidimicrobiales bacterium]
MDQLRYDHPTAPRRPFPRLRRLTVVNLRAAAWAWRAAAAVRRAGDLEPTTPAVPSLPDGAREAAVAVLRRTGTTCLVEATVLQAWDAAHGRPRDLVIGVRKDHEGFEAHAWLDGDDDAEQHRFEELLRRPPR